MWIKLTQGRIDMETLIGISKTMVALIIELKWPITTLIVLIMFRRAIRVLLTSFSMSKIRISLFGIEVETSISELEAISLSVLGDQLSEKQMRLLKTLGKGKKDVEHSPLTDEECQYIRPLRNAGLIKTDPPDMFLNKIRSLALTPLGSLLTRAIESNAVAVTIAEVDKKKGVN
jgi:hypothetical protein